MTSPAVVTVINQGSKKPLKFRSLDPVYKPVIFAINQIGGDLICESGAFREAEGTLSLKKKKKNMLLQMSLSLSWLY